MTAPLTPIPTADFVLAALPPIDQDLADWVSGRVGPVSHLTAEQRRRLAPLLALVADVLPDEMPDDMPGGAE